MSGISETIWPIEPHTRAKHEILKRYLDAWFQILNRTHQPILFIDGFCGPGIYTGGEEGSPVLALKAAKSKLSHITEKRIFRFFDEREDRIAILKDQIDIAIPEIAPSCENFLHLGAYHFYEQSPTTDP